mmetsp:Transcript_47401/g.122628  ORF Transcript_47401/g.122628 Transcript_47401/m.122628 type:complete len:860 (-) Transcript_47401:3562-6141(-)
MVRRSGRERLASVDVDDDDEMGSTQTIEMGRGRAGPMAGQREEKEKRRQYCTYAALIIAAAIVAAFILSLFFSSQVIGSDACADGGIICTIVAGKSGGGKEGKGEGREWDAFNISGGITFSSLPVTPSPSLSAPSSNLTCSQGGEVKLSGQGGGASGSDMSFPAFLQRRVYDEMGEVPRVCRRGEEGGGMSNSPFPPPPSPSASSTLRVVRAEVKTPYYLSKTTAVESTTPTVSFSHYDAYLGNATKVGQGDVVKAAMASILTGGAKASVREYMPGACAIDLANISLSSSSALSTTGGGAEGEGTSGSGVCEFPLLFSALREANERPRRAGVSMNSLKGVCSASAQMRERGREVWTTAILSLHPYVNSTSSSSSSSSSSSHSSKSGGDEQEGGGAEGGKWVQAYAYLGPACVCHLPDSPLTSSHPHDVKEKLVVYLRRRVKSMREVVAEEEEEERERRVDEEIEGSEEGEGESSSMKEEDKVDVRELKEKRYSWYCLHIRDRDEWGRSVMAAECPDRDDTADLEAARLSSASFFTHSAVVLPIYAKKWKTPPQKGVFPAVSNDEMGFSSFVGVSSSLLFFDHTPSPPPILEEWREKVEVEEGEKTAPAFSPSLPPFPFSSSSHALSYLTRHSAMSTSEERELVGGQWACTRHLFYPLRYWLGEREREGEVRAQSSSHAGAYPFDFDLARLMLNDDGLSSLHPPTRTEEKTFITLAPCPDEGVSKEVENMVNEFVRTHRLSLSFTSVPSSISTSSVAVDLYRHSRVVILCPSSPYLPLYFLSPMEVDVAILALRTSVELEAAKTGEVRAVTPSLLSFSASLRTYLLPFSSPSSAAVAVEAALLAEVLGVKSDQCEVEESS